MKSLDSSGVSLSEQQKQVMKKTTPPKKDSGRFNFDRPMDFSIPLYKDDVNKCKYAKQARISWEGVDHLCEDVSFN